MKLGDIMKNITKENFDKIDKEQNKNTITHSIVFDDSNLIKQIDEKLSSLDLNTLNEARQKFIEDNEDTSIIDKAIEERKRRNTEIGKENENYSKQMRRGLLAGLFLWLGSNKKSTANNNPFFNWEKKETKKGNYKPFNFEEEELEDDDYYNEDID